MCGRSRGRKRKSQGTRVGKKNMTMRRVTCRVTLGLAAFAAGLALSEAAFAGPAGKGQVAFMKHGCWQCHGEAGQGGVGPKLAPDPIPFDTLSTFVRTTDRN